MEHLYGVEVAQKGPSLLEAQCRLAWDIQEQRGITIKKVPVQFGRVCAFGDFNGDSNTDILVQRGRNLTVLLQDNELLNVLEEGVFKNSTTFRVGDETVECSLGDFNGDTKLDILPCHCASPLGDHLAEIVFMDTTTTSSGSYLTPRMWGRFKNGWRETPTVISQIPGEHQFVGAPMAADFDADGLIELLVPICRKADCKQVTEFANWQYTRDSMMLFRVGDFSLDGYPDLVATLVEKQSLGQIKVIDNIPCTNCDRNGTRRFEINKSVFIQPKEVALGEIKMASFFDLKEDGNLDILIEYKPFEGDTKFSFIPCDDKGDVTFLKVQVFTNICGKRCDPTSKELGSGVSWSGACASFSMSDGWGGSLKSASCQIPATTHRALAPPYVLFGLGRSPNFVDESSPPPIQLTNAANHQSLLGNHRKSSVAQSLDHILGRGRSSSVLKACSTRVIVIYVVVEALSMRSGRHYEENPKYFGIKLGTYDYRDDNEDEPVNFTNHIQPICISKSMKQITPKSMGFVTGWGTTTEGGQVSNKLRQVAVPFLSEKECEKEYKGEIDETMTCAGRKGIDSCQNREKIHSFILNAQQNALQV
ncbi:FG-GAP repeat protein [Ancylostoma ceylanicum]|uniref:FG-GAP repeat protein n=1 Tax=Ancylostoma ceylanicum TaxID=53326 RepID=A0A0D6L573_9BILA|nr:FG-GAP repeat protein [Ancylostoma ceylanicum]